jgi:hypothetical protein
MTQEKKFYSFRQNNSGGFFKELENGMFHLIVEANSAQEANEIAQEQGVYFNGCEDGLDCECCGDRWYTTSEYNVVNEDELSDYDGYLIIRKDVKT